MFGAPTPDTSLPGFLLTEVSAPSTDGTVEDAFREALVAELPRDGRASVRAGTSANVTKSARIRTMMKDSEGDKEQNSN